MKLNSFGLAISICVALGLTGCGQSPTNSTAPEVQAVTTADETGGGVSETGHSHDGWWCDEHGVPEGVCAQCNAKVAADFKAKGDWCKKHGVPESQCFVCHPEAEAEFAAQYEAKFGKKPPQHDRAGEAEGEDGHEHNT